MSDTVKPVVDQMFTVTSIVTAGGATGVITLVTNTINQFTSKIPAKWIAIVFAVILAAVGVVAKSDAQWYDWVLIVPNACLLFVSALGVTTGINSMSGATRGAAAVRPFFDRWV